MPKFMRTCQECGNRQEDIPPPPTDRFRPDHDVTWPLTDAVRVQL